MSLNNIVLAFSRVPSITGLDDYYEKQLKSERTLNQLLDIIFRYWRRHQHHLEVLTPVSNTTHFPSSLNMMWVPFMTPNSD